MDLVLNNLNLVRHIANKYAKLYFSPYDDFFQEGCIGLMNAARTYEKGAVPFGAYAAKHIQWSMSKLIKKRNVVFVPTYIMEIVSIINNQKLQGESAEVIAKTIGRRKTHVAYALEYMAIEFQSLDFESANKNGAASEVYEMLGYEEDFESNILLEEMLKFLPQTYQAAMRLHAKGKSHAEIAEYLGISEKSAKNKVMIAKSRARAQKDAYLQSTI